MRKVIMIASILIFTLILVACSSNTSGKSDGDEDTVTFKLATPDPDSSPITIAAEKFAEKVEDESNGSIKIDVHANGSLYGGDDSGSIKQLSSGSLDMLVLSTSVYANSEPKFNALSIPYLFDDREQFLSFLDSDIGEDLLKDVNDMGIEGIGYWPREFRQITNSVRAIEEPADLGGLKLRIPNNTLWVDFFESAGASTNSMDFSEVYDALQLETIDGQENPIGVIESSQMQEVQEYLTVSNHMAEGWIVGMNSDKFDELSEDKKQVLEDATEEIKSWKFDEDENNAEETIESLKSDGMKVNELNSEQQEKFMELSKESYPSFKDIIDDDEFFEDVLEFVDKEE